MPLYDEIYNLIISDRLFNVLKIIRSYDCQIMKLQRVDEAEPP